MSSVFFINLSDAISMKNKMRYIRVLVE